MYKTAIIGVSGYGETVYRNILREVETGKMEFSAATIINQHQEEEKCRILREMGCRIFISHKDMLNEMGGKLDLCFIPTGIHLHAPMTIDVLRAGVNVVVEKPAAATVQDIAAMKQAECESSKFVAVGYQTMYTPEMELMKRTIVNGELGKLKTVKCHVMSPRTRAYYDRNNWAGKLKIGDQWILDSPFNNAFAHFLNMICFLGGEDYNKSARIKTLKAELYRAHDIESPDTACMKFTSDTNIDFYFYATHCSMKSIGPYVSVIGDKGRIDWNNSTVTFTTKGNVRTLKCSTEFGKNMFHKFQKRISDPSEFICDLDIAGTHTLCVNAAHESSLINVIDKTWTQEISAESDSVKTIIEAIDEIILESFEKEKMFSDISVPWAKHGKIINLENYAFFPRKLPVS